MSRKGSDLSSERVYITLLGRSVWALLNTYYAITREAQYFPDTVYIAVEAPFRDQAVLAENNWGPKPKAPSVSKNAATMLCRPVAANNLLKK